MSSLKALLFIVSCALALSACSSNTPQPQLTLPINGTIAGLPAGIDLSQPGTVLEATNGSGTVLASATPNADGTFSLTLNQPTADQLDLGINGSELQAQATATGYDCDSLEVSPSGARAAIVYFLTINQDETRMGKLALASSAEVAAAFSGHSVLPSTEGRAHIYVYVDQPTTLTGTNCLRASNWDVSFSQQLSTGWNHFGLIKNAGELDTIEIGFPSSHGDLWQYFN